ncbi:PP2C family protein-serine/threonine phosphatase [Fibrella arboris]|uniref:PP2C family protein-serine/threonine phosphatase n=1 Tax=Fibrella arboris TaxID=3242486 RepID=UPI003520D88C
MNRVLSIYPPVGFTRQGRRDNNEDYVVPAVGKATPTDRLFVVCDGVGGAQRGELASLLAGETIVSYTRQHPGLQIDSSFVRAALLAVEEAFDRAIADETDANLLGMSTTLTLLSLHEQGVTIAHIGDSRVYHIRDGQILHQTDDHSLVNELVRAGQLSPDEVATHPRRNVITRAIQGSEHPTQATVYVTQDLAPDDYFFLCTDGVLESISNTDLTQILLSHTLNDRQKVELILDSCAEQSRDNYSGYLVRVAETAPIEQSILSDEVMPVVSPQVQLETAPVLAEPSLTPLTEPMPEPVEGAAEATPDSFQFTMDDDEEARWRQQENKTWIQRLFS